MPIGSPPPATRRDCRAACREAQGTIERIPVDRQAARAAAEAWLTGADRAARRQDWSTATRLASRATAVAEAAGAEGPVEAPSG